MVKATQLRPGMIIQHQGDLYAVFSVEHRTPGNKRGSMQTKLRNLRSGSIVDYRFRAEDFVERAVLDEIEFEFLYADGDGYNFMNTESFDQIALTKEVLGEATDYLIPGMHLKVEFYEGKPIGVASYRPPHAWAEDFLHNYLGMVGIPIDLVPEFPTDARMMLLTECAAFDPGIVKRIKQQLLDGKSVVITSGLLRALQGKGIEDIAEIRYSDRKAFVKGFRGRGTLPADVTIIDPNVEWTVKESLFKSKSKNSPFIGWNLKGRAGMVIVAGKIIEV